MKKPKLTVKLTLFLNNIEAPITVGELLKKANVEIAVGSSAFVSSVKIPVNGAENAIGLKNGDEIVLAANFKKKMKPPKRIKQLENMATNVVGDGKNPNLFFVSIQGVIVTITRSFKIAYNQWDKLRGLERTLEDRKWGVICDAYREVEKSALIIIDDSEKFKKEYL